MASASSPFPSLRRLSGSIYVLVILAIAVFCYGRSDELLVLSVAAAGISWWAVEIKGWAVPRFILNIILLGAFGYLVWETYTTFLIQSVVIPLARFVVAILLCKLFERKRSRDRMELTLLALVVGVAGMMFAPTGLGFGLLCAAFVCVLCYLAMIRVAIANVEAGQEAQRVTEPDLREGSVFAGDVNRIVKRCLLAMIPIAALSFLLLPRSGATGFADVWNTDNLQTGFSDVVSFRDVEELTPSDQVVMQVKLTRSIDGQNIGSELYQPYFRGQVIQDLDRYRYDPSVMVYGDDGIFKLVGNLPLDTSAILEEYTVFVPPRVALFTRGTPTAVVSDQFNSVTLNLSTMILTHGGGFRPFRYKLFTSTDVDRTAYVANRPLLPPATVAEQGGAQSSRAATSTGPSTRRGPRPPRPVVVSDDIKRILVTIVPDLPADGIVPPERVHTVATAIENYLRTHYRYSLSTHQVNPNLDPITDFLRNRQQIGGYCEYFALGMVELCGAVGIQAREVTGYYGGEFNSVGGYYVVRQRDAHMWVEYNVPGEGWVRGDPTAGSDDATPTVSVLSRALHEITQLFQDTWLALVVTYDNDSRRRLFAAIAGFLTDPRSQGAWILLGSIVGGSVVSLSAIRLLRRRRARGVVRNGQLGRPELKSSGVPIARALEAGFLSELMIALDREHMGRKDMTPREFVQGLALGPVAEDVQWLVQMGYEILWGGKSVEPAVRDRISVAMGRVQAQVSKEAAPPS